MRSMMVTVCGLLAALSMHAQQSAAQPLAANSGFISAHVAPTRLNGATGLLIGGGLCALLGPHARVGLMAATLVNDVPGKGSTAASRRNLTFTYGGGYGEYVIDPESPVHFSVYTLLGGGGLLYHGTIEEPEPGVPKTGGVNVDLSIERETDGFFIAEPGLGIEAGVTEYLRVGAGLGYRFVHGVETDGVSDGTVSGPIGTLSLRLGMF